MVGGVTENWNVYKPARPGEPGYWGLMTPEEKEAVPIFCLDGQDRMLLLAQIDALLWIKHATTMAKLAQQHGVEWPFRATKTAEALLVRGFGLKYTAEVVADRLYVKVWPDIADESAE